MAEYTFAEKSSQSKLNVRCPICNCLPLTVKISQTVDFRLRSEKSNELLKWFILYKKGFDQSFGALLIF